MLEVSLQCWRSLLPVLIRQQWRALNRKRKVDHPTLPFQCSTGNDARRRAK